MLKNKPNPSRAMLATRGDQKATSTWELKDMWRCRSATLPLTWMRGATRFDTVKAGLKARGWVWNWITPLYNAHPVAPPFMP